MTYQAYTRHALTTTRYKTRAQNNGWVFGAINHPSRSSVSSQVDGWDHVAAVQCAEYDSFQPLYALL